jgi:uracil-DNA glycosylase family 4
MSRSLADLERRIVACGRCPRLREHCRETARTRRAAYRDQTYWGKPVPGFGDPKAGLLVLGLAPAAHGANRTGRIFTGDRSGDFLYAALHRAGFANQPTSTGRNDGLRLTGVWITAAARCAPPANKPTPEELASCRPFLDEEFARLKHLRAVLALGKIGHDACLKRLRDAGHDIVLNRFPFAHGAEHDLPDGLRLIDSFHPSQQNTFTGRLTPAGFDRVLRAARRRVGEP